MPSNRRRRATTFVISMAAATFLGMRVWLAAERLGSVTASLSFLSHFFTILTNTAIFIFMTMAAWGVTIPPRISLALASAILGVGLVYHVALKHLLHLPPGLPTISDQGVHTVIPIMTLFWWIAFEQQQQTLPFSAAVSSVVWPLVYCLYILARANLSEQVFYPYPFLNLAEIGNAQFVVNVVCLGGVFAGLGALLLLLQRSVRSLLKEKES